MGLLGSLLVDQGLGRVFSRSRKGRRVLRRGTPATATIIGIRYRLVSGEGTDDSEAPDWQQVRLALRVQASPSFVCGVEQSLQPAEHLRLGQTVQVRQLGDKAVLTESQGSGLFSTQPPIACKAPEPGIDDGTLFGHVLGRDKSRPATITFTEASATTGNLGTYISATAQVQGPGFEPYLAQTKRVQRRAYASHLENLHQPLPGFARPGKHNGFIVDWAAAANATPGTNSPPGYFDELIRAAALEQQTIRGVPSELTASFSMDGLVAAASQSEPSGDVSLETWATIVAHIQIDKVRVDSQDALAQQFGLAPGQWAIANNEWKGRIRKEPTLGPAMSEIHRRVKKSR